MFHVSIWGAWSFSWGAKPTKASPWQRDCYNVTALAIIKPKKHQSLAEPLLQSGVVSRNNHV